MTISNYVVLWEYDKPLRQDKFLNYTSGIWQYVVSSAWDGIKTVVDDRNVVGYYRDNTVVVYDIKSLSVDGVRYNRVYTYSDVVSTESSFMYTRAATKILVHFNEWNPPRIYQNIFIGATVGFSKGVIGDNKPYFNNIYYEPRIDTIFNISQSKDALFYGLLKYTTGSVKLKNEDGYFDDWRDRNLFAQASRILIGEKDDDYEDFTLVFSGLIEDDNSSWTDFAVKLQDPRKGLTQPIPTNLLNKTTYPSLNSDKVDKPRPVKYGVQLNSPCICLNETASSGKHTFLLCDTGFNVAGSLTTVYLSGKSVSVDSFDLTAGTITLLASASVTINGETYTVAENLDSVTADFNATGASLQNGVDIIKDLIYRYDEKNYTSTFWDTTETAIAQALAPDTSVSIDDDTKLKEVIEKICVDISGVFFSKDNGLYTVRIYDANRAITKTIDQSEWFNDLQIENNGSEFLSSVIIKYNHDIDKDKYEQYENTLYRDEVFETYRSYKTATFETNLTTLADAQAKSEAIMSISKSVGDVISRSIPYCTDVEIMDFIVAAPTSRPFYKNGVAITPVYGVYEVLGRVKNLEKFEIKLTMRYIRSYTLPIDVVYTVLIDESGNHIIDELGNTILTGV
jgi:hypothetical protein